MNSPRVRWEADTIAGETEGYSAFIGNIPQRIGYIRRLIPREENKFLATTLLPGGFYFKEEDSMAFAQEKFEAYVAKWFKKANGESDNEST